ncbi:hypothetical protein BpHYR1_050644 [Brachionus plicatilis]|uniref:Uncharacterized protein n=1 Tax=Brachionus plicatilis TaxID=10195 RepID=A0A3M7QMW5_BRAPC|nr:hypothetical protein BpHYR1_050644 [Brachionus plicatilis]
MGEVLTRSLNLNPRFRILEKRFPIFPFEQQKGESVETHSFYSLLEVENNISPLILDTQFNNFYLNYLRRPVLLKFWSIESILISSYYDFIEKSQKRLNLLNKKQREFQLGTGNIK